MRLHKRIITVAVGLLILLLAGCSSTDSANNVSSENTGLGNNAASNDVSQNEKSNPSSQSNSSSEKKIMVIEAAGKTFEVELNDGEASKQLVKSLPQTISMSRWGEGEYYGKISVPISSKEKTRDTFDIGEVALWPSGNSFCIFFGPTPASDGNQPKMASPGVPFGKIIGDVSDLKGMDSSVEMTLRLK